MHHFRYVRIVNLTSLHTSHVRFSVTFWLICVS